MQGSVPTDEATLEAAIKRTADAITALRDRLRPLPRSRLDERPPSGEWSAMENVRHLIFAEQHHFSVLLKGFRWKSVGVPPPSRVPGERRLNPVGKDRATSVDEVFDVWMKVHEVVGKVCLEKQDGRRERLVRGLGGDLRHLQVHAMVIERLLQE